MTRYFVFVILAFIAHIGLGQKQVVIGTVTDIKTGNAIPFAKVQFTNSKTATLSDSMGNYRLESMEKEDSIICSYLGYISKAYKLSKVKSTYSLGANQFNIEFQLKNLFMDFEEITIKAPGELPSTVLIKKVIAHKEQNNKEKLDRPWH